LKNLAKREVGRLEPWPEPGKVIRRKSCQQAIARMGACVRMHEMQRGHRQFLSDGCRREHKPLPAIRA